MRLTLRTLLAWMDGLLPDPERDEIGAKVEASPVAGKLVDRIADVVARPGLFAPLPDGRGLAEDPNTAAEFLDNVLPADRLEAFERICIESDIHLAEIAHCHAMLAELTRNPTAAAPLDPTVRKRLLASVVRQAAEHPTAHEEAAALVKAVKEAVARDHKPARSEKPVPRRESPPKASLAAWLSAGVAILLLLAAAGLLLRSLWPAAQPREVAAAGRADQPSSADAADSAAAPPLPPPTPPPSGNPGPPLPPDAAPEGRAANVPVELPATAERTDEPPAAAGAGVPTPPVPRPPHDQPVAPGVAVPLPQMDFADPGLEPSRLADAPAAPRPAAPAVLGMMAEGGVGLRRVRDGDPAGWQPLAPGESLGPIEELVAPMHAYPRLVRGDVSFRLQPGTQAVIATDADGTPRLEVVFGAAIAWTDAAEAAVGLTAAGLSGVATIGKQQPVGVAVDLLRNPGDDPAVVSPGQRASLFTAGGVRWRQTDLDGTPAGQPLDGIAADQPLPPRSGLRWRSAAPGAVEVLPATPLPAWMRRDAPAPGLDRNIAAALAERLTAGDSVEEALRALARDRRVENRMAAAATLALLGDYGELVGLLCEEQAGLMLRERQWEDLEAATVPMALARGANAAAALRQAFLDRGPAGRGETLAWFARGLAPADWPEAGGTVIEALEDETLAVRRYAFLNLRRLFPAEMEGRIDYRPDRSPSLNEQGVAWWRRKIEAGGGRPPPASSP